MLSALAIRPHLAVLVLATVVATVIGAAGAEPATALTRAEAKKAALAASAAKGTNGDVIIFGLRRPLGPRQSVSLAGPANLGLGKPTRLQRAKLRPLGRRTWLFWEDLVPGAHFQHPSRVILVDDRTGRTRVRNTGFFPLIDGRRPAFLRSWRAYHSGRWQVFRRIRRLAAAPTPQSEVVRQQGALPASAFAGHCVYLIGAFHDPLFRRDFKEVASFAQKAGIKSFWATNRESGPFKVTPSKKFRTEGTVSEIAADLKHMRDKEGCKDILFYVAGHDYPAKGSAKDLQAWLRRVHTRVSRKGLNTLIRSLKGALRNASRQGAVLISDKETAGGDPTFLTQRTLELAMKLASGEKGTAEHLTYKLKFQSCFSGRFVSAFTDNQDVLMVEASSGEFEPSFSYWGPPGKKAVGPRNPGVSEFTWANIVGWRAALKDPATATRISQGESPIVAMSAVGWAKGLGADRGEWLGFTTPQLKLGTKTPTAGRGQVPGSNPPGQSPPKAQAPEFVQITPPPLVIPPG